MNCPRLGRGSLRQAFSILRQARRVNPTCSKIAMKPLLPIDGGFWKVIEKPKTKRGIVQMRLESDDVVGEESVKASVRRECFTGDDRTARLVGA